MKQADSTDFSVVDFDKNKVGFQGKYYVYLDKSIIQNKCDFYDTNF